VALTILVRPGWQRTNHYEVERPEHDRCFYSLAAAIRKALIGATA
jgi:hypothetical protein